MHQSLLETIGKTPLLSLSLAQGLPGKVLVKLENKNPGGSIKDRVAKHLLTKALESGKISQGSFIVEATSGNMGIGLALVSKQLGLKCVLTMPESMSLERRKLLAALGAELILTSASGGMGEAVAKSKEIAKERNGYIPGQFTNPLAVEAHYTTTGPEIYEQTEGQVDYLVAGVGSGSSLMGAGKFLKSKKPDVKMIAVEPKKSPVLSGGKPGRHAIQGIGAGFVPEIVDLTAIDEILPMDDDAAIATSKQLITEAGIICGISSGANVRAALDLAAKPEMDGRTIVTFICDSGERYLSTALFEAN